MNLKSIINLGIKKAIDRDTALILEQNETSMFIQDTVGGVYMMSDVDLETGKRWLMAHEADGYPLSTFVNEELMLFAKERYGLNHMFQCYQAAYQKKELPDITIPIELVPVRIDELSNIMSDYSLISDEEMSEIIKRNNVFWGIVNKQRVGFIGEHLEGSMGILYVYPEFREKGYGSGLEKLMIRKTMKDGNIPYCQVEINNTKSLNLQTKLGLELADEYIYWLF